MCVELRMMKGTVDDERMRRVQVWIALGWGWDGSIYASSQCTGKLFA